MADGDHGVGLAALGPEKAAAQKRIPRFRQHGSPSPNGARGRRRLSYRADDSIDKEVGHRQLVSRPLEPAGPQAPIAAVDEPHVHDDVRAKLRDAAGEQRIHFQQSRDGCVVSLAVVKRKR